MDSFETAVKKIAEMAEYLWTAYTESVIEAAEEIRKIFDGANEQWEEMIACAVKAINESNAAIERHQKERISWVHKNERIKPLLIDKRRKVHRCRNNC